jgi:hypothetical protein
MNSGAADAGENLISQESYWTNFDRNKVKDFSVSEFHKHLLQFFQ